MDIVKSHKAAVRLLKRLGLSTIRLEREDGHYRYVAWSVPLVDGNGSPKISKRGKVQAK
jgi:hypothetical protein